MSPSTRFAPVLLSLVLLLAPPARAQVAVTSDTGRTVVAASGTARATYVPDRASITLFIEPQAMSAEEAGNRLAVVERAVLDTLRRFNLPASAIHVSNGGIAPYRSNMSAGPGPSFSGRSAIRVELSHPDMVMAVSGAALARGATLVSPPTFTFSGADSLRRSLVPQAYQNARREAEALAAASGGRLGRLLDLSENPNPYDFQQQAQAAFVSGMIYDSGQRSVPNPALTVTVNTRWLLVGGPR